MTETRVPSRVFPAAKQDADAAEHVARVGGYASRTTRVVHLRERSLLFVKRAGFFEIEQALAVQGHAGDIHEHVCQALLDDLVFDQRPAELVTLGGVL